MIGWLLKRPALLAGAAMAALAAGGWLYVSNIRNSLAEARQELSETRSELESAQGAMLRIEKLYDAQRAAAADRAAQVERIMSERDQCLDEQLPASLLD